MMSLRLGVTPARGMHDPNQHREYAGSHLILPHGAQYKERLFPEILKPWNHWEPLTNSVTKEPFPMELVGDFRSKGVMATHSCTLTWTWADSGSVGYTFLHTGVKSQHHWLLPICKPSSPRPQSGPHHGPQLQTQLWNLPSPNTPAARAGITIALDVAPTHQLQSALTLLQPRSLPIPKSQLQMNRTSLPGVAALTSMAIPPPYLPSQSDANRKKSAQKTPTHSTPHFSSAPVGLTASAV